MSLRILDLLGLQPSEQSRDYVQNKKQFHLFDLLTEQRHPKTWNLSFAIKEKTEAGLRAILSVDRDIVARFREFEEKPALLEQAVRAVKETIRSGGRIYVYGCGATGRLAKQIESAIWRPFWRRMGLLPFWDRLRQVLPEDIEERLIGEMTGGDRALVSALEGFEDLLLIGELQLQDRGIRKGDLVFCVTEGGETSSVIGTILAALQPYGSGSEGEGGAPENKLYFIYNNPDERLRPFERSVRVIDEPRITRINLTTGPQAVAGSTRLQATTSETYLVGILLECAVYELLAEVLSPAEMRQAGWDQPGDLRRALREFAEIQSAVEAEAGSIARFTELESDTYRGGRLSTYLAREALITVFIDGAERSPTFRLFPLDKVIEPARKCWFQVWTEADSGKDAWHVFLGRGFRGLAREVYQKPFEEQIPDPYLREAALRSLSQAGSDQEVLYDFSMSGENLSRRAPQEGDLGVLVVAGNECSRLSDPGSFFRRFLELCGTSKARTVLVAVCDPAGREKMEEWIRQGILAPDLFLPIVIPPCPDPMGLRRQIMLKMVLNAHSSAVMSRLGRMVGNTMTNVSPSNLKLIGRATYLIQSHVNDALARNPGLFHLEERQAVRFEEANAVLMDSIRYVAECQAAQTAEVALSIIRILESLRRQEPVGWDECSRILGSRGLEAFLLECNPGLAYSESADRSCP